MSEEAKHFMFGLERSRAAKGMKWYGNIPEEIIELFGVREKASGYVIAGVYVKPELRYKPYTPDWLKDEK